MKRASYISVLTIANLLLGDVTSSVLAAGQGKNSHKQRGTLSTNGGSKETANQNAQWSADPDRGWVRSEESHSTGRRDNSSAAREQTDEKTKETGRRESGFRNRLKQKGNR